MVLIDRKHPNKINRNHPNLKQDLFHLPINRPERQKVQPLVRPHVSNQTAMSDNLQRAQLRINNVVLPPINEQPIAHEKKLETEVLSKTVKYSTETISPAETKLWAYTSIAATIGCIVWGVAAGTMGPAACMVFVLLATMNFVYQRARLSELKYDAHFPLLTEKEKEIARSAEAPKVAVLIPAYHEPPEVLRKTIWSAVLQDYARRDVVLLNDNNPSNEAQQKETQQINAIIAEIDLSLGLGKRFIENLSSKWKDGEKAKRKGECAAISQGAFHIANWLDNLNNGLGGYKDLTDQVTREKLFLERRDHFNELGKKFRQYELAGLSSVTAEEIAAAWRELAVFYDSQVVSFERKTFANLPHTINKATNINAYLSLEGRAWVAGEDKEGNKIVVAKESQEASLLQNVAGLSFSRHDYFLIIDSDTRIFPGYFTEAIPFMERETSKEVSIFQSPTWSLPSKNPTQHIASFEMNLTGLLEKGYAVRDIACWAGSNGVLRRSVLESITEDPENPNISPYRKIIRDDTVIEDYETDLKIKTTTPTSKTVYARQPLCILINPENWGELEIQRQRWANGPYILLKQLIQFGRNLSAKMYISRVYRYLSYTVNITATLCVALKIGALAGNPFIYLYTFAAIMSIFRPLKKRGFTFKDSQVAIMCNLLLIPTYLKGHIKTIQQMITGKKSAFTRTPKDGSRTRISLTTAAFSLGSIMCFIRAIIPDVIDLLLNGNLIATALQLYAISLISYGVSHMIGFRNLIADMAFQIEERVKTLRRR